MINNVIPTPKRTELFDGCVSLPLSVSYTEPTWCEYAETLSGGSLFYAI